jgi:hypothetical protein
LSDDFYHDDPVLEESARGFKSKIISALVLVVGSAFLIQSTLAANISLNNGTPIEFGQGITATAACSGANNLTVIPSSTFINSSGTGAYYLSSVAVSNIPTSCYGSDFKINAYNNSSSTPLALFNTTSSNAVVYDNAGTFELGSGSVFGASITSGSGSFIVTFTNPVATSGSVFKLTLQSGGHNPLTCADGGSCVFGERGPGGGIVFYVSATNFTSTGSTCNTTCRYLEVAPATWQSSGVSVADDAGYNWSTNFVTRTPQVAATSPNFGQGFYNTSVMRVDGATSSAQAKTLSYAGGGFNGQWFIPSMSELNELCKYARGQTTGNLTVGCSAGGTFKSTTNAGTDLGGFREGWYWSSSEDINVRNALKMNFTDGGGDSDSKAFTQYVRPIRAFGP